MGGGDGRGRGGGFVWPDRGQCECPKDACANLGLYVAMGRLPMVRDWITDTASAPYEDVQRRALETLQARPPAVVILQSIKGHEHLRHAITPATLLHDWLDENYDEARRATSDEATAYRILRRRASGS